MCKEFPTAHIVQVNRHKHNPKLFLLQQLPDAVHRCFGHNIPRIDEGAARFIFDCFPPTLDSP